MRFACGISKDRHTLRICNTYCFSTATMVARRRLNVTLYVRCLSCVIEFPLDIAVLVDVKILEPFLLTTFITA